MSVVRLDEAKAHLNFTNENQTGELQSFIDAAEAAIEQRVGPLGPTEITATVRSNGSRLLMLPVHPVVSVTSIATAAGSAVTSPSLDGEAGLVSLGSGADFPFGDLVVTYTAGRSTLPADLRLAVLELVRHLWETQRGPTRRPGGTRSESASNTIPGAAYMFPFRVEQLLAPHEQHGVA